MLFRIYRDWFVPVAIYIVAAMEKKALAEYTGVFAG
jgi:hypothetical protein